MILEIAEINKGCYYVWKFMTCLPPTINLSNRTFELGIPPYTIKQTGQVNIFGNVNFFVIKTRLSCQFCLQESKQTPEM